MSESELLEPWECHQPLNEQVDATPWLGLEVVERPDGGGWPLEKGVVREHPRQPLTTGWFDLVSSRNPDGILTHKGTIQLHNLKAEISA